MDDSCNTQPMESDEFCYMMCIPVEIFYHIVDFLDMNTIVFSLRLVCKKFAVILSEDGYWRTRLKEHIGKSKYPLLESSGLATRSKWQSGTNTCWRDVCFHAERDAIVWKKDITAIENYTLSEPHYASIDAIKLFNDGRFCITGGRDRILAIWDLSHRAPRIIEWHGHAHQGWIWDIKGINADWFYSADWDGKVFRWSASCGLKPVDQYVLKYPALALGVSEQLVVVGMQCPSLYFLDPRIGHETELWHIKAHKLGVMDVCLCGNYVVSVSEDKTMAVSDIRSLKRVKSIPISEGTTVPVSISRCRNVVYIADNGGKVSSFLTHRDFKVSEVFRTPHDRLTSIYAGIGSIFLSSRDQYFNVITPTCPITVRQDVCLQAEISKVDYDHGNLVLARSDRSFTLFKTGLYD